MLRRYLENKRPGSWEQDGRGSALKEEEDPGAMPGKGKQRNGEPSLAKSVDATRPILLDQWGNQVNRLKCA